MLTQLITKEKIMLKGLSDRFADSNQFEITFQQTLHCPWKGQY